MAQEATDIFLLIKHDNLEVLEKALTQNPSLLKQLSDNGSVLDIEGEELTKNVSPLHFATECNNIEAVDILLKAGADLKAEDSKGRTPLHYAAFVRNKDISYAMMMNDPTLVNLKDQDGKDPKHYLHGHSSRNHETTITKEIQTVFNKVEKVLMKENGQELAKAAISKPKKSRVERFKSSVMNVIKGLQRKKKGKYTKLYSDGEVPRKPLSKKRNGGQSVV